MTALVVAGSAAGELPSPPADAARPAFHSVESLAALPSESKTGLASVVPGTIAAEGEPVPLAIGSSLESHRRPPVVASPNQGRYQGAIA